jgi:hypothetical protein
VDNTEKFPSQLRHRADAVIGAAFCPPGADADDADGAGQGGQLLLRSHGFLCLVDLAAPLPTHARIHPQTHLAARNDLARRARVKQQRASHLRHAAARAAADQAAAAAAHAHGDDSQPRGLSAAALGAAALGAAGVGGALSSALKRQRSNSTGSVASAASASELVGGSGLGLGGGGGSGATPARRLRSDSITSASSDHFGGFGAGHTPLLGRFGAAGHNGGGGRYGGGSGEDEDGGNGGGHEDDLTNDSNRNFAITLKYRPVLFADYLGPGELLVVEEPWLKIMQRLPDPLFRQRFGT